MAFHHEEIIGEYYAPDSDHHLQMHIKEKVYLMILKGVLFILKILDMVVMGNLGPSQIWPNGLEGLAKSVSRGPL